MKPRCMVHGGGRPFCPVQPLHCSVACSVIHVIVNSIQVMDKDVIYLLPQNRTP